MHDDVITNFFAIINNIIMNFKAAMAITIISTFALFRKVVIKIQDTLITLELNLTRDKGPNCACAVI